MIELILYAMLASQSVRYLETGESRFSACSIEAVQAATIVNKK